MPNLEYSLRVKEGDLRGDIKERLKREYPNQDNETIDEYVERAMTSIKGLGNHAVYRGLILVGIESLKTGMVGEVVGMLEKSVNVQEIRKGTRTVISASQRYARAKK